MADVHLFCDYWASVLSLRGVVGEGPQRRGLLEPRIFRNCLDRPEARLPRLRYYVLTLFLGPVLVPYRMFRGITSRRRAPLTGDVEAARLLSPFGLHLESAADGQVDVTWKGETLAAGLADPRRLEVIFSVVYPSYKILTAALLAIALSLGTHALAHGRPPGDSLVRVFFVAYYPALVLLLWLIYRDGYTAVAAPLPVFLVVWVMELSNPLHGPHLRSLALVLAVLAVAYFLVDGFLLPRGVPPTLYLYVNDPASPDFPYAPGQAPTWLAGKHYWVWRFVSLTTAEVSKFWERDWERVEVWVRADAEAAGEIEWVVVDFHYRELWMPKSRLVSAEHSVRQARELVEMQRDPTRRAAWVVEVDMDVVFHSPILRGIFLTPLEEGWKRARLRQLVRSLRVEVESDHARDYREAVRHMVLGGHDLFGDIPEHFRGYALRHLLRMPWRYWRYPRGANTVVRPHAYSARADTAHVLACEPELQIKAGRPTTVE